MFCNDPENIRMNTKPVASFLFCLDAGMVPGDVGLCSILEEHTKSENRRQCYIKVPIIYSNIISGHPFLNGTPVRKVMHHASLTVR